MGDLTVGERQALLEWAASSLESATGKAYWVDDYSGDEDTESWGWAVYAAPEDGSDEGHALADASQPGWVLWLVEQATQG